MLEMKKADNLCLGLRLILVVIRKKFNNYFWQFISNNISSYLDLICFWFLNHDGFII